VFKRGQVLAPLLQTSKLRDEAFGKFWVAFSSESPLHPSLRLSYHLEAREYHQTNPPQQPAQTRNPPNSHRRWTQHQRPCNAHQT
jgi:hypothetical protein